MKTESLIEALTSDLKPVPRHAAVLRLVAGLLVGAAGSVMLVAVLLGFRPDLGTAIQSPAFWMKWGYTISLGVGALAITLRMSRPEPVRLRRFWPILLPFAALALLCIAEMAHAPPADWLSMWLGKSWRKCPYWVTLLSIPIFVGLLWSFRRLAPTRLRLAGAAAGLAAGAWSATLYCLHCPEVSPLFVLTWYTLGILIVAGVGAIAGPRLLRW